MQKILDEIKQERERQKTLIIDGKPMEEFDKKNTRTDWITYIVRYAVGVSPKLEWSKDKRTFREAMIKAAALAIAAIEAKDKGYC
jgi:hypothetical protein